MPTTYTVAAGAVAKHGVTLVANDVITVTFTDNVKTIEIISDGVAAAFYSLDKSTPAVNGANCYILPAGTVSVDVRNAASSTDTVKIISSGTPTISVQGSA